MKVISILELCVGGGEEGTCLEQSPERVQPAHIRLSQASRPPTARGALCVNNLIITTTLAGPERGTP